MLAGLEDQHTTQIVDEYIDDEDPGFDLYEVDEKDFQKVCKKLAEKFNFPSRSCMPDKKKGSLCKILTLKHFGFVEKKENEEKK